jgi:pyruvate/2-oxoglutarate dehydrogenase complex dihydrolipoamide acyltransferase (E2) component
MDHLDSHPNGGRGDSEIPIVLPDLGTGGAAVGVSAWFVEPGDVVEAGERILEVAIPGVTCDVSSPSAGRITRLVPDLDAQLLPGSVVAWLVPAGPGAPDAA